MPGTLVEEEWETGAVVVSDALPDALLKDLERDVNLVIDAFDGGYEPPARPGSLTSGTLREIHSLPANCYGLVFIARAASSLGTRAEVAMHPVLSRCSLDTILAGTFWMPIERASSPRNAVERAIAAMYASDELFPHLRARRMRGAEWWVQDVAPDEPPKVFHTDCDVQTDVNGAATAASAGSVAATVSAAASAAGGCAPRGIVVAHPAVASVLYLSDVGGATAVFGQAKSPSTTSSSSSLTSTSLGDASNLHEVEGVEEQRGTTTKRTTTTKASVLRPRLPAEVAVAHPRRNRLLLFEGDRYHAVMHPSPAPANAPGQRVTVLVNWWKKRPGGAADLPERFRFITETAAEEEAEEAAAQEERKKEEEEEGEGAHKGCHTGEQSEEEGSRKQSAHGLEAIRLGFGFLRHLEEWRRQRLPTQLAALGPGRGASLSTLSSTFNFSFSYRFPFTFAFTSRSRSSHPCWLCRTRTCGVSSHLPLATRKTEAKRVKPL